MKFVQPYNFLHTFVADDKHMRLSNNNILMNNCNNFSIAMGVLL